MSPPIPHVYPQRAVYTDEGINLRDYFAGQALAGCLAYYWYTPEKAAEAAYKFADKMLEAR